MICPAYNTRIAWRRLPGMPSVPAQLFAFHQTSCGDLFPFRLRDQRQTGVSRLPIDEYRAGAAFTAAAAEF